MNQEQCFSTSLALYLCNEGWCFQMLCRCVDCAAVDLRNKQCFGVWGVYGQCKDSGKGKVQLID